MSTLRLPGLQTGIDTNALIEQLMVIERRTLNTIETRKNLWQDRKEALSNLEGKLKSLRTQVRSLSDADVLKAFNVTTSDEDILTASATNEAFEGNHTVVINQLATAERSIHTAGLEYKEDLVGAGTFIYSYNHQESTITTTAATTLQDFVGLINNDANNPGVTASLLYYNGKYHLVLNGQDAGSAYKVHVNPSSTEVWQANTELTQGSDKATLTTKIVDLDQFTGPLTGAPRIQITGTNRNGVAVTQVNLTITENTRLEHLIGEINDAFDGIAQARLENGKIILVDNVAGASDISITLTYNANGSSATLTLPTMAVSTAGGSPATLSAFDDSDFTETQIAKDSKIKVDGFPNTSATSEIQSLTKTSAATAGTFTLTYDGHTTAAIAYNASTAAIQAALEALSNVNSGDITLAGSRLDEAGATTFTFASSLGDVSMISIDPTSLTPSTRSNYVWTETAKGDDGYISRSSNTIDDVISGVSLHLHDTTSANGEEISITRDIQSVKNKIDSLVASYNSAVEFIKEKTGYNNVLKTAGVLMSDYVVSTFKYQFREPLIQQTAGFVEDIDTFLSPLDIGLSLDKDGFLSFDTNKFDQAVAKDYMGALNVIGADKTGSSNSTAVKFYSASTNYTTAGEYDVQVTISGGAITNAKIKLSSESTYRTASFSENIVTGNSTFDTNGDPVYAENGLQLSVDRSTNGIFTAKVWVKQGFAGKVEDRLDKMLKATVGSIIIDQDQVDDQIDDLDDKITLEEWRLTKRENRLVARFARLERTLALLQSQLAASGIMGLQTT